MSTGTRNIHIVVDIRGVLSRSDRELKSDHCKWITRIDGSKYTPTELRVELCKLLAKGLDVIPASGCDDYDPSGRCRGHSVVRTTGAP